MSESNDGPLLKCQQHVTTLDGSKLLLQFTFFFLAWKHIVYMFSGKHYAATVCTKVIIPHMSLSQDDWTDFILIFLVIVSA